MNKLKCLTANAILMARHGNYANGITDGFIDEGNIRAIESMDYLEKCAKELGIKIHSTFLANERFYNE